MLLDIPRIATRRRRTPRITCRWSQSQPQPAGTARQASSTAEPPTRQAGKKVKDVAELVDKLHAICVVCGGPASRNQRLLEGKPARYDSPVIMVGAQDSYEARCRQCHDVPRRDEDQVRLL